MDSYDLSHLDAHSFEHLVNALALRTLGPGLTTFGPGSDGGRDGYFEGRAPYPSQADCWAGTWYIQSKFHKPHLSADPQKWLLNEIKSELKEFERPDSSRKWPTIWIVATNIEPSGHPDTGAFDSAKAIVTAAKPDLARHFAIWGGRKILDLLIDYPNVAQHYGHFLTPGDVISELYQHLSSSHVQIADIIKNLTATQFADHQHTKLEQAGSSADNRPGIHRLFTDLPFVAPEYNYRGMAVQHLARCAAQVHRAGTLPNIPSWQNWRKHPNRTRAWFIKGGPGQGKSTIGQYLCQIQRAALLLGPSAPKIPAAQLVTATEIRNTALAADLWPTMPRIPVSIELKDFAQWFGRQKDYEPRGILSYLCTRIGESVEQPAMVGTLKRAFKNGSWLFVFDGLDEVPSDVKDPVAAQVIKFNNSILIGDDCDALVICTSRPQGYAGQFAELDATAVDLSKLSADQALACAQPVLQFDRNETEFKNHFETLKQAIASPSVRELMTTPLQAHIMAVVVREGGKPPERKWHLFTNYYQTIKKREANRNLLDGKLANLLREGDKLLKSLHNRLGFELHFKAERSEGAQTSLPRSDLRRVLEETVTRLQDHDVVSTVDTLMEATTERLVLVSTPETGSYVRFDIRPLQEFFAAEYIYEAVAADKLGDRLRTIAADSHWREVMHFLLSALVENDRQSEIAVAVNVLNSINDGGDDFAGRHLFHRIGAGALLTARLLNEGVLDQDKRIRNQFRGPLAPSFGATDLTMLIELVGVRRPQSRSWIYDELMNAVHRLQPSENIGAVFVLCRMLPDEDPRTSEVTNYVLGETSIFRSCVLQLLTSWMTADGARYKRTRHTRWVRLLALRALLLGDWHKMGLDGIRSAFEIVRSNENEIEEICHILRLDQFVALLLKQLLSQPDSVRLGHSPQADFTESLGVLKIEHFRQTDGLDHTRWTESNWASLEGGSGFLTTLHKIYCFAKGGTRDRLKDSLISVGNNVDILFALPGPLSSYLPFDDWQSPSSIGKIISESDDSELAKLRKSGKFGCSRRIVFAPELNDTPNLEPLLPEFPRLAYWLYSEPYDWQHQSNSDVDLGIVQRLVNALVAEPELLIERPESWGKLFQQAPNMSTSIEKALLSVAHLPVSEEVEVDAELHAFELNLPNAACLLPHIVNSLVRTVINTGIEYHHGKLLHQEHHALGSLATQFAPHEERLQRVAEDEGAPEQVRAAAAMMGLLHPRTELAIQHKYMRRILDLYAAKFGSWYLPSATLAMESAIFRSDSVATACASGLMKKAAYDYVGRMRVDPILDRWRQHSHAPVNSSHPSPLWN